MGRLNELGYERYFAYLVAAHSHPCPAMLLLHSVSANLRQRSNRWNMRIEGKTNIVKNTLKSFAGLINVYVYMTGKGLKLSISFK